MRATWIGLLALSVGSFACGSPGASGADASPDAVPCAPGSHLDGDQCVPDCPLGCSGHGTCLADATCACFTGYDGSDCSECAVDWHWSADHESCTQSLCDPDPCAASSGVCNEITGACCDLVCELGDSECASDQQRQCIASDSGCWIWSEWSPCGGVGCADALVCNPPAPGVTIDQWGSAKDDQVWAVAAGSAGEVLFAGQSSASLDGQPHAGGIDLTVGSRNLAAAANWTRQRGSAGSDAARAVLVAANGEVFTAGYAGQLAGDEPIGTHPFLTRWSAEGAPLWTRRWGSSAEDQAYGMTRDSAGNFFVAGWTSGDLAASNAGDWDAFVTKLDPDGVVVWSAQWGSAEEDYAIAVAVDGDGNVYTVGQTLGGLEGDSAGSRDAFLTKHLGNGDWAWTRQWGSSSTDGARAVAVAADGAILVTGYADGDLGRSGDGAVFLGKWDAAGNELWIEQWGAPSSIGRGVVVDTTGAVFVAGRSGGVMDGAANQGLLDAFVSKWTHSGSTRERVWSKQYGTAYEEYVYGLALTGDGTIYVAGKTPGAFPGFVNQGFNDNFLLRIVPE